MLLIRFVKAVPRNPHELLGCSAAGNSLDSSFKLCWPPLLIHVIRSFHTALDKRENRELGQVRLQRFRRQFKRAEMRWWISYRLPDCTTKSTSLVASEKTTARQVTAMPNERYFSERDF